MVVRGCVHEFSLSIVHSIFFTVYFAVWQVAHTLIDSAVEFWFHGQVMWYYHHNLDLVVCIFLPWIAYPYKVANPTGCDATLARASSFMPPALKRIKKDTVEVKCCFSAFSAAQLGWGKLGAMLTSLTFAHLLDATQHWRLLKPGKEVSAIQPGD